MVNYFIDKQDITKINLSYRKDMISYMLNMKQGTKITLLLNTCQLKLFVFCMEIVNMKYLDMQLLQVNRITKIR